MKKLALTALSLMPITGVLHSQIVLTEYWNFDDPVGTDLNDLSNDGTLGSSWNFNTPNDLTDGSGQFVIGGDGGTTTRKLPIKGGLNADPTEPLEELYDTPITTGVYTLTVTFSGWNVSGASVGDVWKLGVNAADTSTTIAQVIFEVDSATSVRLRAATETTTGSGFRNFAYGLVQSDPVTVSIEFDFDNDIVRYLVDGSETHYFDNFSGSEIGQLIYVKSGDKTDDWITAASSISIDSMGLTTVPEPEVYSLVIALIGFGLVIRSRRRG
jgi:hypothetical protein